PALFIFSDKDGVVRPELTRAIAAKWGAPHEVVVVDDSEDPSNHVIAGDALSPSTTELLTAKIGEWITNTVP
ncbi:MAG TPA: alpha/beta hydrolase, partial [Rhizobiaceae bacterium]|nr:alpha/beta hydrolase [Rhizobiaceae bacterium]